MDFLKEIYKTIPEKDIAHLDFARGYSIAEHVWNDILHIFFKEKLSSVTYYQFTTRNYYQIFYI